MVKYNKRHNKFLFPALAEAIYGSSCKAENEISNVVNYSKESECSTCSTGAKRKGEPKERKRKKLCGLMKVFFIRFIRWGSAVRRLRTTANWSIVS